MVFFTNTFYIGGGGELCYVRTLHFTSILPFIRLQQLKSLSSYMLTHYYFLNEYSLKLTSVFELNKKLSMHLMSKLNNH